VSRSTGDDRADGTGTPGEILLDRQRGLNL
jgi:hypothetical protein